MRMILQSVGRGGANIQSDVQLVQTMLNKSIKQLQLSPLRVDGRMGSKTIGAIEAFQNRVVGMDPPDGRVDPSGTTLRALASAKPGTESHARVPLGARQTDKPTPKWLNVAAGEANWLGVATQEDGQDELAGAAENNPRIVEYLSTVPGLMKVKSSVPDVFAGQLDETPWCACFVNWCLIRAGLPPYPRAMAADWLKYGRGLETPLPGAITVVYKKPKTRADRKTTSSGYHVAFYVCGSGSTLTLFGGNQGNKVCEKNFAGWRVDDYRWPL
jgi:uncharacterized protein (TIGR02594 family)